MLRVDAGVRMSTGSVIGLGSRGRVNPVSFQARREVGPENSQLSRLLLRERIFVANNLYRRDLKSHYGCVNAIEFSNGGGEWIISGGDDRRVLMWHVQRSLLDMGRPISMKGEHISNIFCLAFDQHNRKIFSGGNDEQVVVHDVETGSTVDVFRHEDAVYGLSSDPNNENVFASACDDGRVLIYDIREPASTDPFCLANYTSSMHAVMYNPMEPRLLATANAREGVGLWDIRKPKTCCLRYGGSLVQQSCMSVRFSSLGGQVLALRRRLPPVLYHTHKAEPVCEFDHSGYYNSCTMKSCSFAGDRDQYVLSGSDDFNLYMWKIPEDLSERQYTREAHMVLKGHRSIVNQVRYNPTDELIISSGVEKIVKVWSPFLMPQSSGDLEKSHTTDLSERPVYTPEEYINLVLRSGHIMSHDYSHHSTEEDPRMMAFFDSLVQGEMDMSSDDLSSNEEELYERIVQVTRSELENTVQDVPDDLSSVNSGDESDFSPFTLAFASVMAAQSAESSGHSRLLDVQDASQSGAEEEVVEGDQSASRKSISEIIEKNRKEVLKAIDTKKKSVNASKSKSVRNHSSSSDSDSGDEPTVKRSRNSLNISEGTKRLPDKKVKNHLKRLRDLRNKALNSDSEASDTGVSIKRICVDKESRAVECVASCSGVNTSSCSASKDPCPGLGPYLHETDGPRTANFSERSNSQSSFVEGDEPEFGSDSRLKQSSKPKSDIMVNRYCSSLDNCQPSTGKSELKPSTSNSELKPSTSYSELKPSTSNSEMKPSTSNIELKPSSNSEIKSSNVNNKEKSKKNYRTKRRNISSDENISEQNSEDAEETNEPLWTEFKRFKNRLERARRYYRKQSSSQPTSDDEQ